MVVYSSSTKIKLFAVINNGIVVDGWIAESLEEAQKDNPKKIIVEVTPKNSPIQLGTYNK